MSGVFGYDEAVAEGAHGEITSVARGLQGSLDDLGGFVARVKSNWSGDEMHLYEGVQQKWDTAATTVKSILDTVNQALDKTTNSVQQMRSQVRNTLQG